MEEYTVQINCYKKYFKLPYTDEDFIDSYLYFHRIRNNINRKRLLRNYIIILLNSFDEKFTLMYLKKFLGEKEFEKLLTIIRDIFIKENYKWRYLKSIMLI